MRQLKITRSITQRDSRSLAKYLTEIGRVDLLSSDQEVELARRIKKGDQEALNQLVKANLRFVVSVAKQYKDSYLSLNDLINEGNLGLIMAAQKFDETKGFKFISYAIWWVRQSILKAIAEQSRLIRLPLNRVTSLNKLNRTLAELEQQFGREPSADELAEIMHMEVDEVNTTVRSGSRPFSIDEPVNDEEDISLHDVLRDTGAVAPGRNLAYTDSLKIDTSRALASLTEKQKEVIELYFGIGSDQNMSLQDIAKKFGLNKERIRQIKEKALNKIRVAEGGNALKEYLCQ